MAPVDGLDALDQRRAARSTKRRLPPARHPKAEAVTITAAGPEPAEAASEQLPELEAPQAPPLMAAGTSERPAKAEAAEGPPLRRRSRVRATQVHLDETADDQLSELRKRAVLADVDLTASAVLRLGLAELVELRGYDGIVKLFADDDGRVRRGRPRR